MTEKVKKAISKYEAQFNQYMINLEHQIKTEKEEIVKTETDQIKTEKEEIVKTETDQIKIEEEKMKTLVTLEEEEEKLK